jgi:hypothetical protein
VRQRERLEAVIEQTTASRRAAELARIQYREGAVDFLRLLDAERAVLAAEDAVATAETDVNTAVVLIYKALGGGWEIGPGRRLDLARILPCRSRQFHSNRGPEIHGKHLELASVGCDHGRV